MKTNRHPVSAIAIALALAAAGQVQSATVTLNATDAVGASSFNSAGQWSNAAAPSAANDYVVAVQWLRTPQDANSYTFAGNSLTLSTNGGMIYKGTAATNTYTINNFVLNGGTIRSGAGSGNTMVIAGNLTVNGTGSIIAADQSPFIFNSALAGTGALTLNSGGSGFAITLNGTNTYTGNLTVNTTQANASTTLSSTSSYKFAPGASGVCNTIAGAGKITFNGTFAIDLTAASTTIGDSWMLVSATTLAETYGATFTIPNFTSVGNAGSRIWTHSSGRYQFSEVTGTLNVIPPDLDADGLADAWEDQYFGNNDGTATAEELALQNGTGDPDGDGCINENEESAGTDPTLITSWPDTNGDGLADGHVLATGDAFGVTSFNTGTNWDDGQAPAAGYNYLVAVQHLRTPTTAGDYTFAGDNLVVTTGGNLLAKMSGTISANYRLDGGRLHNGTNDNALATFAGTIVVTRASEIWAQNSTIAVTAPISGNADLNLTGGNTVTFSGTNTWTGTLNATAPFVLDAAGTLAFAPGATGVCNKVTGTGAVTFNGTFAIDLASAGTTIGDNWTLVDGTGTKTYGSTFALTDFTSTGTAGSRIWTHGWLPYQFFESTGVLSVFDPASDSDFDGLSDAWEYTYFPDLSQGGGDDPDSDGATNEEEETAGTIPTDDTSWPDADADGLKDAWEIATFGSIAAQNATGDPDGDLASNLQEFTAGTDARSAGDWPDTDGDAMNDGWEVTFFGDLAMDGTADSDGDSYTDFQEHNAHTNPTASALSPIGSALKHRWSFNGVLTDAVGGSTATVVDVGANQVAYNDITTPTAVVMTGGARDASDYVQLGTNLLPKSITPVTIELWATPNAIQNWSRVFDFHTDTNEYAFVSWTQGTTAATDNSALKDTKPDGTVTPDGVTDVHAFATGTEYHILMTIMPLAGASGATVVTVYSAPSAAASLGLAKGSFQTTINLVNLTDAIDALGRSPWAGDNTASATYNEVRIWNGALTNFTRELLHSQGADNAEIADTDADFLPDAWEEAFFPGDLTALATAGDCDGDTFSDRDEYAAGSNPTEPSSTPLDLDADGLADAWETANFASTTAQDGNGDPDHDFATNLAEFDAGTNPNDAGAWPDTDLDTLNDGWETHYFSGLAEVAAGDPDMDGADNATEMAAGSDPTDTNWTPAQAILAHRWSFNGSLTDAAGGSDAQIVEVGANNVTQGANEVTLAGGDKAASDYVSLGTNLLQGKMTPVTIELWATPHSVLNYGRIFDFGSSTDENLFMSWSVGTNAASDRVAWKDTTETWADASNAPYALDTEYHIVMTLVPAVNTGGELASGTRVTWYSAPSGTGHPLWTQRGTFNVAHHLVTLNDVNNWLGCSQWPDATANASFNEVRIWEGALTENEREVYQAAGPDGGTSMADTDFDTLPDAWEMAFFGDLDETASGDPDNDGAENLTEFADRSNPASPASTPADADGDTLVDAWEVTYFGGLYDPEALPGLDLDGDHDTNAVESANSTDPNLRSSFYTSTADTVSDSWKAYFGIPSATGNDDSDADGALNVDEFYNGTSPVDDDSDDDGLVDGVETGTGTFVDATDTGTDPLDPDSDNDGLADGAEVITHLSNPLLVDTDADGFWDALEVAGGSNPGDAGSIPAQPAGFSLVEDFEGTGMTVGQTFNGVNGWTTAVTSTVVADPVGGDQAGNWAGGNIAKSLAAMGLAIAQGHTGTLFFQVYIPAAAAYDEAFTLSDAENDYWQGECNMGLSGANINARNGATATDTGFDFPVGQWFNVWFVVDNTADTYSVYIDTPTGSTGQTLVASGYAFRNGTQTTPLVAFICGEFGDDSPVVIDNIHVDPTAANLANPVAVNPDTDADNLPDDWEIANFGTIAAQDAAGDPDADGTSNRAEYLLGLDPNDGSQAFVATATNVVPGSAATLAWPAQDGLTFKVWRSQTLQPGSWLELGSLTATSITATFTDMTAPPGRAFYRIELTTP